jgi:hypothetical protein
MLAELEEVIILLIEMVAAAEVLVPLELISLQVLLEMAAQEQVIQYQAHL